jgi:UDP-N-acetylmuramoyl-L-alanyl-D-glutamate--2,6-diaminopimelate ligase
VKLSQLTEAIKPKKVMLPSLWEKAGTDPDIGSIHYRSQTVKSGGLFVAIPGHRTDGHAYIDDAVDHGATAVVCEKTTSSDHAAVIEVESARIALAQLSGRFYGDPSLHLWVVGVTGTNGKTTTTYLIESILKEAGFSVGVIGTVNCRYGEKILASPMTTPESLELQKMLHDMRAHGVSHVVMEVSSHAIDLSRVENCWFDVGVFTNFTQDHLDYHKDMETYWGCKKRLFTDLLTSGPKKDNATAVINCDDPSGRELYANCSAKKLSVAVARDAMLRLKNVHSDCDGIYGELHTCTGKASFRSPLVGGYNAENIACAAGAAVSLNQSLGIITTGIENMIAVPGRLEKVENEHGYHVYVDYAHTPDALHNVLKALDGLKTAKLICIFGCGGNRDPHKRPWMGEIAGRWSDLVVVTTDNPRNESPEEIIRQIEAGLKKTMPRRHTYQELSQKINSKGYIVEPDRKEAIRVGIEAAAPEDLVLIAGKGHETYQIVGYRTLPFDDRKVAQEMLLMNTNRRPA